MAAIGGDTTKGLLLPFFDGEPTKFKGWWMRFKAYATIKNFSQAIQRIAETELPATEDMDVSADKPKKAARDRNLMAISCLTMSFQDDALLNMIEQSETAGWPSGLAYRVIDELFKKYRPVDIISRVEMRTRLSQVSMKQDEDPRVLFNKLASIQSAYNNSTQKIDPYDLIAVVLEKAPSKYKSILTAEQRNKGSNLTLNDLNSCMNDLYRTMNPNRVDSKEETEVALSATSTKFKGICRNCKKPGHMARDCRAKKVGISKDDGTGFKNLRPCRHCGGKHMDDTCWELPKNANNRPANWKSRTGQESANVACDIDTGPVVELLLSNIDDDPHNFSHQQDMLLQPDIWIGDTAATVHMSPHEQGMINIKNTRGGITVGNGEVMIAKKQGNIPCEICDKYGNTLKTGIITDVALTKGSPFNLFSLTKMMKQGWTLGGDKMKGITLKKEGKELTFDIPVETPKGVVYAMYMRRTEVAAPAFPINMSIEKAHRLLGHQSEEATRKTAKHLGWNITKGALPVCLSCTIGKAKQKNTVKSSEHTTCKNPGERIYTDIASIRPTDGMSVAKPHWCIKVDERTQLKFSSFHKHKDDMVEESCELFSKWKSEGNPVKYIRCDNAGENKSLQKRANGVDWKFNIQFEFTPRDTPQHNHLAELGLASIANKGRTLMSAANVPKAARGKLWIKAFDHATNLDGLIVTNIDGKEKTRYEHWYDKLPKWSHHLRTWGESGTVKIKTDTTPKIADRGIQCMFVGYSKDHDGDCYDMWYPKTNKVYTTRDVIWLNKMYYNSDDNKVMRVTSGIEGVVLPSTMDDSNNEDKKDEDNKEDGDEDNENDNVNNPVESDDGGDKPSGMTRSGAQFREIAATNIVSNPVQLTDVEIQYMKYMTTFGEIACVGAGLGGGFKYTTELHVMKYDEAMRTPDVAEWNQAVEDEHQRMIDNKVWMPVPKAEVPEDAKILTSTWAMKKKANGTYRARLNGRGFEQVPGVHFDPKSIAAPVVSLMTIRIVFILMLMAQWPGHVVDVRGAFLKGDFAEGETLYLHVPQGMERHYKDDVYLLLLKTLYGLKQAAYRFWLFLLTIVHKLECQRSKADPCLYFKWTENGKLLLWFSWVDDCFMTGPKEDLFKFKAGVMNAVECDDGGEIKEFVGCKVDINRAKKTLKLTQPVLLQSFTDEFQVNDNQQPLTPGIPTKALQIGTEPAVHGHKRSYYRSGVGKLMHLRRWSRPDMANAVRDLSRFNTNSSEEHLAAMHRAMCYAITTPTRGLTLAPNGEWDGDPTFEFEITGVADASYKPYHDTTSSVGGHAVFLQGATISEKSKVQQSTTLSVTEAELNSGMECIQDMLFAMRILESVGLKVKKPMNITIDNKGAVDYANNWTTGGRMRHAAVKLNFMRELKERGIIEVNWCRSEDMPADLFTKNLGGQLFQQHTAVFCGEDDHG
jgi:hypothetical protein